MPTYKIRDVDVDFPYEAYDCQLVYMEKVIQSLQERCNALLESPTGTGKTLCLLCATLAWRKSLGDFSTCRRETKGRHMGNKLSDESQSEALNLPTILYASRTHSQLRQVIQELKRTSYRPKMVVLGSREQLCIHEEVSLLHGRTQTNACHSLCKKRKKQYCSHFPRVAEFMKDNPGLGDEPVDIEELVNIGKSCGPCPYYVSRELHKVADIMFAPYNYLIDRGYRKSLSVNWKDSILIFDEAHNLEGLCAEAASFDLSSWILTACISEAKNCIDIAMARRDKSNDKSCNPDDFAILRALLLKLEKRIAEVPIESRELGFTKPGPYIYELLADLNITYKTSTMLIGTIEEAALLLEEESTVTDNEGPHKMKGMVCRLESMGDILKLIFRDGGTSHAGYYRFHVQEAEANATAAFKGKASRTLSWWCFNPGLAMDAFSQLGVGSIILTSGTLSPMDSFAQEFKLEFPIRLENPHVISANQIWVGVVPSGPSGYAFNSSYRSRDLVEYKLELGNAIVNFARIVPDGLLVFFPSYYLMDQCIGCWKNMNHINSTSSSTVWERICKHKQPVVEPRQSSLFPLAIDDFMTKLKDLSTSGAVFFAVCRGKVSEGLDFADHAGRAVVITGMPFATRTDPKVRLKREYLDTHTQSQKIGSKVLTGEEWYGQQASRAVNQAVGRVIRHRHDYGAIIFCDERFAHSSRRSQISLWIQPHIKAYSKFGEVVFTLTRFFRDGATCGPTKLEIIRSVDDGNANRLQTAQSLDKLHLEKILAPLSTPMDSNGSVKFPSCISEVGDSSSRWGVILPANRSTGSSYMKNRSSPMKYYGDCNEKNLSIPRRKSIHHISHEQDFTNSSVEEETKEKLIAPCYLEKPKIEKVTQPTENPPETSSFGREKPKNESSVIHLVKHEKVHVCDYEGFQRAQVGSAELLRDKVIAQKSKKNEVVTPSPAPCGDEEGKGSAFLIQVREKLTDPEYGEFVACMKALKSKTMKIGQALQSIVRIFSSPDRLPLLLRFKDYIPAKYHSLYEQYLKRSNDAVEAAPINSKLSVKILPSISEVDDNPSHLGGILPANRSTLPSNEKDQSLPVTYPSGLLCNEKILSIRRRKSIHHIDHEQDLTTNSSAEEETKGKLIAPCFLKKPKIENLTQPIEDPLEPSSIGREKQQKNDSSVIHLVKHEKSHACDYEGFQSAQMGSADLLRDEVITQKSQKNKVVTPSPAPCGDEERKGSAFLIQVREKLTDPEYREFVACMKALKSKTMKIGQALQSIVRIFSSPDRLPLLLRFKDYIPAKFHSLYEQYLKRSDDAIEII